MAGPSDGGAPLFRDAFVHDLRENRTARRSPGTIAVTRCTHSGAEPASASPEQIHGDSMTAPTATKDKDTESTDPPAASKPLNSR